MGAKDVPQYTGKVVWKSEEKVSGKGGVYIQVEVSTHPGKKLYANSRDYEILFFVPVGAEIEYNVKDDKFINDVMYEHIIEDKAPTAEEVKSKVLEKDELRQESIETQFAVREAIQLYLYEKNCGVEHETMFDPTRITSLAVMVSEVLDETRKINALAKSRRG